MEYSLFCYSGGERIGIVEGVDSLQWQLNARAPGEMKLVVRDNAKNRALLQIGNILQNSEYPDCAMLIVAKSTAQQGAEIVHTVRGLELSALLARRVLMGTVNVGNVEAAMRKIIAENARGLPITAAPSTGATATLDTQISWGDALEAIEKLADASGLCFATVFDGASGGQIRIFAGTDRTSGANYIGYFGDDLGNLDRLDFAVDETDYRNSAIVAGEGEGTARVVVTADIDGTEPRREMFVDAKDIRTKYQVATPTGNTTPSGQSEYTYTEQTYTAEQYAAKLKARGVEKLRETRRKITARAEINDTMMRYDTDYRLGDILPIQSKALGLLLYAEIESVTIIYEQLGKKIKAALRFV